MTKNIVLIGMPGSGKTTIGKLLSERFKRSFIDMDVQIEQTTQQTVAELFAQGEDVFRQAETQCAKDLACLDGYVIASGGGVITRPENMSYLKQQGIIFYIDRSIDRIAQNDEITNRPLLRENAVERLQNLYDQRHALYEQHADYQISNNALIEETLDQIEDYVLNHVS